MAESQNSQHEYMQTSLKDWSLAAFPCYSLQPILQRQQNFTKTSNALIINKSFLVTEKYFHHKK